MSRCRCEEKRAQESLISTLERAWDGLSDANGYIYSGRTSTERIVMLYPQSSIQTKMQNCVSYLSNMSGTLGSVRGRIDGGISSTLSELYSDLEDMTQEDDDYHEEQERAEEEAAARKAAEDSQKSGGKK